MSDRYTVKRNWWGKPLHGCQGPVSLILNGEPVIEVRGWNHGRRWVDLAMEVARKLNAHDRLLSGIKEACRTLPRDSELHDELLAAIAAAEQEPECE